MFGNMLAQMQQQQEQLQAKLKEARITEKTDGVSVTVSGDRTVQTVSVDPQIFADGDPEQLEDLLVIAVNRALQKAADMEKKESEKLMSGMLPGGLGSLGSMFGM